jgi:hypothetical protein
MVHFLIRSGVQNHFNPLPDVVGLIDLTHFFNAYGHKTSQAVNIKKDYSQSLHLLHICFQTDPQKASFYMVVDGF